MSVIVQKPSDHCDDRRGGAQPSFIVIHYTETRTLEEAEDYFLGRRSHPSGGRVSAHYMIGETGETVQYVAEDRRAWHAGASHWAGLDDINSHSVGIELVNPGRRYGYRPFPALQMRALTDLCRGIVARHGISLWRVLGHSDIAPARKADPGELFDWRLLAKAGLAVWPEEEGGGPLPDLRAALCAVGYDPAAPLDDVVTAFRRRFCPEYFGPPQERERAEMLETARLRWLLRHSPETCKLRETGS